MAINNKVIIQHRRGALSDFDPRKMSPGELAVTTDGSRKVFAAFEVGDVKELASSDEVNAELEEAINPLKEDILKKLDKNQGEENSGKLIGIDESGNAIPILTKGVGYNPDTNCLEYGSAHNLPLMKGILLDETLTKIGHAADAKAVGAKFEVFKQTDTDLRTDISGLQKKTEEIKANATEHNTDASAHNDIRILIAELVNRLNAIADSDDQTLDQLSEIVAYIKNNKSLIDGVTTSKVNVGDIVNNLTTNVADKPLSAAQGIALKGLIDGLELFSGNYADLNGIPSTFAPAHHEHQASDIIGALKVKYNTETKCLEFVYSEKV